MNNTGLGPPVGGNAFSGWLGSTLLKLSGWRVKGELPHYPKMVIAVAPHTSNWDFFLGVAVLFYLRIKIRFLGKHTIFIPVFKQLLNWIGGIPVDRRSRHGVVEQIAAYFDKSDKMILALSPEGTRSPIFPWKTGFISIAHKAQARIQLVGFDFRKREVIFGPNFMPSGDRQADMQEVYKFFTGVTAKYPKSCLFN